MTKRGLRLRERTLLLLTHKTPFAHFFAAREMLIFRKLLQKVASSYLAARCRHTPASPGCIETRQLRCSSQMGTWWALSLPLLGFTLLSTHKILGMLPEKEPFGLTLGLWNGWKSNNVIAGMRMSVPGSPGWCRSPGCEWAMTGGFLLPVRACWSWKHNCMRARHTSAPDNGLHTISVIVTE